MTFSVVIDSPENILPHRSILVGKDKKGPCSDCPSPMAEIHQIMQ